MFLEYGVDEHNQLVHISQAARGRVDLRCPYCGGGLLSRKGQQLIHHFAHDGETCREVERDFDGLTLPIYDRFNVYLSGKLWGSLQRFHSGPVNNGDLRALLNADLIREEFGRYRDNYELTNPKGKIPFGEATLAKFAEFQDGQVYKRHNELQDTVQLAAFGKRHNVAAMQTTRWSVEPRPDAVPAALADLHIYRAQVQRVYSQTLYLLLIEHSGGKLYKIGVTARDLEQRIAEIERDLHKLLTVKAIKPIRVLERRGAVERYAHHRYRAHRVQGMGTLTEYFEFDKKTASNVKRDFTTLGDYVYLEGNERHLYDDPQKGYVVSGLISEIIAGERSQIEQTVDAERQRAETERQEALARAEAERQHAAWVESVKAGMEAAKADGVHVGRPPGSKENGSATLAKYPDVVTALQDGLSLRKAARAAGVSVNTVRKVKAILDNG